MSDKPQGPGWMQAHNGTGHPPEPQPSMAEDAALPPRAAATYGIPQMVPAIVPGSPPPPKVGPEATVTLPGPRAVGPRSVPSLPVAQGRTSWSRGPDDRPEAGPKYPDLFEQVDDSHLLVSASAAPRMPAEIGEFTGASAKKRRWRL